MNNADMPIEFIDANDPEFIRQCRPMKGLSKREYFAGLAMQGILASDIHFNMDKHDVADQARQHADALLVKLEDTK